ncbi:hypothetical protein QYE76_017272 [Lolium multiflorum]|uniref:Reverse transcriptase Ty1/copia-type domain-containing protein n=1 Tax=Lolium multiflorum TaxID=4521 RepID=A0AAD8PHY3_LOLMU|nr:hypothetical protein QYE76_017272 [Lolium multiflorum]
MPTSYVQDQLHYGELTQETEKAQIDGQDGIKIVKKTKCLEALLRISKPVQITTRRQLANFSDHQAYISVVEPKKVFDALEDPDWLDAMHEELNNFKRNKVWILVEKPKECRNVIGTKWIFKNKQDEHGIFMRNKARLVAQAHLSVGNPKWKV